MHNGIVLTSDQLEYGQVRNTKHWLMNKLNKRKSACFLPLCEWQEYYSVNDRILQNLLRSVLEPISTFTQASFFI